MGLFLMEKKVDHLIWTDKIKDAFLNLHTARVDVETDCTKCGLGQWIYSEAVKKIGLADPEFDRLIQQLKMPHEKLHASVIEINKMLTAGEHSAAIDYYHRATDNFASETLKDLDSIIAWNTTQVEGMQKANTLYATQTLPALKQTQSLLHQIRKEARSNIMTDDVMLDSAHKTQTSVMLISIIALVTGSGLAFWITYTIVSVLIGISSNMSESASQVAAASSQVSSTSHSLAEGASQQAATIEETCSSLEQISEMTERNADDARAANSLMQEANRVLKEANDAMDALRFSMTDISHSSQETSKIVKTIDEIAFQTNLLALNAAVEAARSGEAGAGFTVVADEVRNLAKRAAEAAKNTSTLIEGTVRKIEEGSRKVLQTNEAFNQVAINVSKGGNLVGKIASASGEQARAIEQVNLGASEISLITQLNASNAEESASASEEMSAQAMQLRDFVTELMVLIGGNTERHHRIYSTKPEQSDHLNISGHLLEVTNQ